MPRLRGHKLDSSLSIFERACQSETGGKQDRDLRNPGVLGHHRPWMNESKQSLWRRCFQFQGDKKPSQNQRIGSGAPKMPRLSASRHIGCPLLPLNKGVRECVGSSSLSCCSQTERGSNAQIWLAVKHLVLTSGNDTCPTLGSAQLGLQSSRVFIFPQTHQNCGLTLQVKKKELYAST